MPVGDWVENEMNSYESDQVIGFMKTPVISSITEVCDSVNEEEELAFEDMEDGLAEGDDVPSDFDLDAADDDTSSSKDGSESDDEDEEEDEESEVDSDAPTLESWTSPDDDRIGSSEHYVDISQISDSSEHETKSHTILGSDKLESSGDDPIRLYLKRFLTHFVCFIRFILSK